MSYDVTLRVGVDSRKAESTLGSLQSSLEKTDKSARRAAKGMKLFEKASGEVASVKGTFNEINKSVRRAGEGMKTFEDAAARVGSMKGTFKGFTEGLRSAGDGMKRFQDAVHKVGSTQGSMKGVEQSVGKIGGALSKLKGSLPGMALDAAVNGFKAMVNIGSAFHAEMSNVAAMTGASREELDLLTSAARSYGEAGTFSAQQAAKAQSELAATGMSVTGILSSQGAVMELATATNGNFANAAGMTSNALSQFGLGAKSAGKVANLFAEAVRTTGADIDVLGKQMDKVGPTAAKVGLSLEETTAALSLFGEAGVGGVPAADAFKAALEGLTNPSVKSQKVMERLGLQMEDSTGKFVGMEAMMQQLGAANLNHADSIQLFGTKSASAITAFVAQGKSSFTELKESISGTNAATEMAGDKLDNLGGDWSRLTNSLESVAVNAFGGVREPMRGLVQGAAEFVSDFSETIGSGLPFDFMKAQAELWAEHTGGTFELIKSGFAEVGITGESLSAGMARVGEFFVNVWQSWSDAVLNLPANFKVMVTEVVAWADKLGIDIETAWKRIGLSADRLWETLKYGAEFTWLKIREFVALGMRGMIDGLAGGINEVADLVAKAPWDWAQEFAAEMRSGADALKGFGGGVKEVQEKLGALKETRKASVAAMEAENKKLEDNAKMRKAAADDAVALARKEAEASLKKRAERVEEMQEERKWATESARIFAEMDEFNKPVKQVTDAIEDKSDAVQGATGAGKSYREQINKIAEAEKKSTGTIEAHIEALKKKKAAQDELCGGINPGTEPDAPTPPPEPVPAPVPEPAPPPAPAPVQPVEPFADAVNDAVERADKALGDFMRGGFENLDKFEDQIEGSIRTFASDLVKVALPEPFEKFFEGGIKSFKDFTNKLIRGFRSFIGDMLYESMVNPIMLNIKGMFSATGGAGGAAATAGAAGAAGQVRGITDALKGSDVAGGFNKMATSLGFEGNHFGGSNIGYGISGIAGGFIGEKVGGPMGGAIGSIGSTIGYGLATGGGALSLSSLGMAAGPVGAVIGALLGGLIGKIFGGKPSNKSAYGQADLATNDLSGVGNQTGEKQASQQTMDARDAALASVLTFDSAIDALGGNYAGSIAFDIGERDGVQVTGISGASTLKFDTVEDALDRVFTHITDRAEGLPEEVRELIKDFDGDVDELLEYAVTLPLAFESVNSAFDALGLSMDPLGGVAYATAMAMVEAAGGLEQFNAVAKAYHENFYSDEERRDFSQGQVIEEYSGTISEIVGEEINVADHLQGLSAKGYRELLDGISRSGEYSKEQLIELIPALMELGNAAMNTGMLVTDTADSLEESSSWGDYLQRFYSEDEQSAYAQGSVYGSFNERIGGILGDDSLDLESIIGGMSPHEYRDALETFISTTNVSEDKLRQLIPALTDLGVAAHNTGILIEKTTDRGHLMTSFGVTVDQFTENAVAVIPQFKALKDRFRGVLESISEAIAEFTDNTAGAADGAALRAAAYEPMQDGSQGDVIVQRLDSIEEYRDYLVETIRMERELTKARLDGIISLRGFIEGLSHSELSTLTSEERLSSARAGYETLLGEVESDPTRVGELTEAARLYLETAQNHYASSSAYTSIWDQVHNDLGDWTSADGSNQGLITTWQAQAADTTAVDSAMTELGSLGALIEGDPTSGQPGIEQQYDKFVLETLEQIYTSLTKLPQEIADAIAPYYPNHDIQPAPAEEVITEPESIEDRIIREWQDRITLHGSKEAAAEGMLAWARDNNLTTADLGAAYGMSGAEVDTWLATLQPTAEPVLEGSLEAPTHVIATQSVAPEVVSVVAPAVIEETRPSTVSIHDQWDAQQADAMGDVAAAGKKMREWAINNDLTATDLADAYDMSAAQLNQWLDDHKIDRFATGGIAAPWTPAVIGDGPDWEAVIPLKNGSVPVDLNVDGVVEAVERSGRASVGVLMELGHKIDEMAGELGDLRRTMTQLEMAA